MVKRKAPATGAGPDAGSFRDRSGHVFAKGDRVFRSVSAFAADDFQFARDSGFLDDMVHAGRLLPFHTVDTSILGRFAEHAVLVLEHPRLDYVSYPYEWSFPLLKAAAVFHLDIHLDALERGVNMSDASAYNVQFRGVEPVFIDHLSFRRYENGEYWIAHRQFCESFLNALLLRSECGVAHNDWYRGRLTGISVADLNRLLPLRSKLSWNTFSQVALQARFQASGDPGRTARSLSRRKLPLSALQRMLRGLRNWIVRLEPADTGATAWQNYSDDSGYADEDFSAKAAFVEDYVKATQPRLVWDLGCNTGVFSQVALEAGARGIVAFDADQGALERAYARAKSRNLNILPLYMDVANPSPDQGWNEAERQGMFRRAGGDGLLALALLHHIAITHNVPLEQAIDWLVRLAPAGIIEFVPKEDDGVKKLLSLRDDVFHDYTADAFVNLLQGRAQIARKMHLPKSGRILAAYRRNG